MDMKEDIFYSATILALGSVKISQCGGWMWGIHAHTLAMHQCLVNCLIMGVRKAYLTYYEYQTNYVWIDDITVRAATQWCTWFVRQFDSHQHHTQTCLSAVVFAVYMIHIYPKSLYHFALLVDKMYQVVVLKFSRMGCGAPCATIRSTKVLLTWVVSWIQVCIRVVAINLLQNIIRCMCQSSFANI